VVVSLLRVIIQQEIIFALRDWINRKLGWAKQRERVPTASETERSRVLKRRTKDRKNRRASRG